MSNPSDWEQRKIYSSTWKMDEYVEVFIDTKVAYKGNLQVIITSVANGSFCCKLKIEGQSVILGYSKIPTRETKPGFLKLAKTIQNKHWRARDCVAAYIKYISIIYCAGQSVTHQ